MGTVWDWGGWDLGRLQAGLRQASMMEGDSSRLKEVPWIRLSRRKSVPIVPP